MANTKAREGMEIDVQPLRTKEEIALMIEALGIRKKEVQKKRDQLLFKLGITTGLRVGDIVKFKISDVLDKNNVTVLEGKTKKKRDIFIEPVKELINEYMKLLPPDAIYLFPSRKGDSHITTTQAYRILTKAADLLGRKDIGTHTMRKTFAYHYYMQNRDVAELMNILNHSSQSITLRYIGVQQESINQKVKKLNLF